MKSAVLFEGIPVVFSDDDMIHHIDSHRLGDLHELMGRCDIATGRGRVVGWMVVYKRIEYALLRNASLNISRGWIKDSLSEPINMTLWVMIFPFVSR